MYYCIVAFGEPEDTSDVDMVDDDDDATCSFNPEYTASYPYCTHF